MEKERDYYKSYIVSISLVISICTAAIFFGIAWQERRLVAKENLVHARALFNSIVLTRKWNAAHGGVYVEKKAGVHSSPYLPGTDITGSDGRTYFMRNPALMVREISELADRDGQFRFHMTSLNPINPQNAPGEFEKEALVLFEKGIKEQYRYESREGRTYFRYVAPLYVEKECLPCHAKQGYKIGDVRGGISVVFNVEGMYARLKSNVAVLTVLAVLTLFLLLGSIYFITLKFFSKLNEAREKIETLAVTDGLTGLANRRHLMQRFEEEFQRAKRLGKELGCILLDIDYFKSINDRFGHLVGDDVLRALTRILKESVRKYDIVGRFGGEEFLVILPDTSFEETKQFAERMRELVKGKIKDRQDLPEFNVSISLGIASLSSGDVSIDNIVRKADDGLYSAKNSGRDRVGWV